MRLKNKVAVVTGGSQGIGAAIVKRLSAEGAKVAFTYNHHGEKAAALVREIHAAGGRAMAIELNLAANRNVEPVFDEVVRELGGLDIVVANAGNFISKQIAEATADDFD